MFFIGLSFSNFYNPGSNMIIAGLDFNEGNLSLFSEGLAANSVLQWKLADWNEAWVGSWWNSTSFRGTVSAQNGTLANLTITEANVQNYTSSYWGIIEFGNFSETVDNAETASFLSLSIYPWYPGLVTHTNWAWHEFEAQNAVQEGFMNGTLSISETKHQILGTERNAIIFTYKQDKTIGNQNTTLVYDKETGVLLETHTEILFGTLFKMKLILVHSDCRTAAPLNAQWKVARYNEAFVGEWYNDLFAYRGKFAVIEGSLLNFTITGLEDFEIWGNIEIGNFSDHVSDNEVASTLAIGMWPWNPGLFVIADWQNEETAAQELGGSLTIKKESYLFEDICRTTKVFDFKQDPAFGNQNVTLIYDFETGLLLKATAELNFGTPYFLELELKTAPIAFQENGVCENSTASNAATTPGFEFLLVLLSLIIAIPIDRLRKKSKQT
ncbi:MAG: hypothetical protein ACFFB3_11925, partial [Candidatus Hodarchaeota archaeon]